MAIEHTYIIGKHEGTQLGWYANGQKYYEWTYKDGEFIYEKEWDYLGKPTIDRERPLDFLPEQSLSGGKTGNVH